MPDGSEFFARASSDGIIHVRDNKGKGRRQSFKQILRRVKDNPDKATAEFEDLSESVASPSLYATKRISTRCELRQDPVGVAGMAGLAV